MDANVNNCRFSTNSSLPIAPDASVRATAVARYHDAAMPEMQRAAFEVHLDSCAACAEELEQLRAVRQGLRTIVVPKASRDLIDRLQSQWEHVPQLTVMRFVSRLTKIAAIVAVVSVGHLTYQSMTRSSALGAVPVPPAVWEQAAIVPESSRATADEQASARNAPQFAEFIVQDLGPREGGRP